MKFLVKRLSDSGLTTLDEEIESDYVQYPDGMLVFKNSNPRSYPVVVKMYAPGYWSSVTALEYADT
jgi:hypothetical protein